MKKPTSSAPHICRKVSRKICPNTVPLGRMNSSMTSQETRMEVPPMKGVKAKATEVVLPVMDETALSVKLNHVTFGSGDQGPVHNTTITIRMMKGRNAAKIDWRGTAPPGLSE